MVGELFAAEDMKVQVLNTLATVFAAVGDDAVAVGKPFGCGDFGDRFKNTRYARAVFFIDSVRRCNVFLGHDENVYGCHGRDIAEGVEKFGFIYFGGRDLALDDLTKNAIVLGWLPFLI